MGTPDPGERHRRLAYIGAAISFVSHSDGSFWGVILGLLQGISWPVYVIFHVLTGLGV